MHSIASRRSLILCLLIALGTGGCASGVYRTPDAQDLGRSALATLEEPSPPLVTVGAINGKSRPWGIFERYELAPGQNRITVRLVEGGATRTSDPLDLEFVAEPGATYVLRGSSFAIGPNGGRWNAWIVNKQSGKTVSSPVSM